MNSNDEQTPLVPAQSAPAPTTTIVTRQKPKHNLIASSLCGAAFGIPFGGVLGVVLLRYAFHLHWLISLAVGASVGATAGFFGCCGFFRAKKENEMIATSPTHTLV